MAKLFSLDEANGLLPTLEDLLGRIQERKRSLEALQEQLGMVAARAQGNGHANEREVKDREAAAERAVDELNRTVEKINAFGCDLKDLDRGLVDFPHERDGRVVCLCWLLGEPEVAWWHESDAGFTGRQPL